MRVQFVLHEGGFQGSVHCAAMAAYRGSTLQNAADLSLTRAE